MSYNRPNSNLSLQLESLSFPTLKISTIVWNYFDRPWQSTMMVINWRLLGTNMIHGTSKRKSGESSLVLSGMAPHPWVITGQKNVVSKIWWLLVAKHFQVVQMGKDTCYRGKRTLTVVTLGADLHMEKITRCMSMAVNAN